jgi:hypothetical protein
MAKQTSLDFDGCHFILPAWTEIRPVFGHKFEIFSDLQKRVGRKYQFLF